MNIKRSVVLFCAAAFVLTACGSGSTKGPNPGNRNPITNPGTSTVRPEVQSFISENAKTEPQLIMLGKVAQSTQEIVDRDGKFDDPVAVSQSIMLRLECLIDFGGYTSKEAFKIYDKIVAMTYDSPEALIARHNYFSSLRGTVTPLNTSKEACGV